MKQLMKERLLKARVSPPVFLEPAAEFESIESENMDPDGFGVVKDPIEESSELSGECGIMPETVFWSIDEDGVLHIYGEGGMRDWNSPEEVPWYPYKEQITKLDIAESITGIGSYAFSSCNVLKTVRVG